MQYVCSDIHGRYDKWCALLAALDLKPTDTLYVLGDVIDRGPDGIKVLQDMAQRLNVIPILGNHELDAALCIPKLLQEVTDESIAALSGKDFAALSEWLQNGGGPTLRGLQRARRPSGRNCWIICGIWIFTRRWKPADAILF